MEDKKYVAILMKILDKEDFKKLYNELYVEVYKKFKNISEKQAKNIINLNLATIVVFAIEKQKGCKKIEFNTRFYNYNIGARIFLVERAIGKFEKRFNYYIEIVNKHIKENKL